MKCLKKALDKKKKGQGMTEYIIIVALIAVATITLVTVFGDQIRELFFATGKKLEGDTSYQAEKKVTPHQGDVEKKMDDL